MYKAQVDHSIFRGEYYELHINVNVDQIQYPFVVFDYNNFHTKESFYISLLK